MSTNTLKCYNCGGTVIVGDNPNIGICSRCLAEVPVPKESSSITEAHSRANLLLSESRFDEALAAFREILVHAPLEAAAYWGYAVSEYGIEFVQDPATAELLPTLHRLSTERFSQYLYVKKAIEYAPDYETQQFYEKQSKLIDSIQSHSLQLSQKEEPYDIFICYKKTEEGEKRTSDSRIAADLYKELVRRGYKTFFAEETLHVGEEYEPRIFAALNSAKVMLAIGSKTQYYEGVWVRNEWSRYVDLIRTEETQGKQQRLLIPIFYNLSHDQIPAALQKMPKYVDMTDSINAKQVLFDMISTHFSGGGTQDDAGDLRRQVRGQSTGTVRMEVSVENFVTRGTIELANGNFEKASEMFLAANDIEESSDAYLGLLMCEKSLRGREALHQYAKDIRYEDHFQSALNCASAEQKKELEEIASNCLENLDWATVCAREQANCEQEINSFTRYIKSFSLDTPAHQTCFNTTKLLDDIHAMNKMFDDEVSFRANLRRFLYWGNLFPAVSICLNEFVAFLGWNPTIKWLMIPGVISMLIWYVSGIGNMLASFIPALEEGCIPSAIRIGIGYALCMGLIGIVTEIPFLYLCVSAVASAVFYIIWGRPYNIVKRKGKAAKTQATANLAKIDSLKQQLSQESFAALNQKTAAFRQFYRNEDWDAAQKQWSERIKALCEESVQELADEFEKLCKL